MRNWSLAGSASFYCGLVVLLPTPSLSSVRFPSRSTTVFSHAQTAVMCSGCATVLCHPTGGKASITDGCEFRPKPE